MKEGNIYPLLLRASFCVAYVQIGIVFSTYRIAVLGINTGD